MGLVGSRLEIPYRVVEKFQKNISLTVFWMEK
jgi:hypothetical protein